MNLYRCLASHSGKGVFGVCVAALLLAWPPAGAWIMAVCLLGWSVSHLKASFRELEHAEDSQAGGRMAMPSGQLADASGSGPAGVGPPLDAADVGRALPRGRHPGDEEGT
jgi:hypothetical protein